jgi:Fe-S-cluster containining protein
LIFVNLGYRFKNLAMKEDFIDHWRKELPVKSEGMLLFLLDLKQKERSYVDEIALASHREVFDEIDCLACAHCCKTTPPILKIRDVKRIASFLKMGPKQFRRKYILEDVDGELSFRKVPCEFLEEDNKCKIYDVRPESCRGYPHTDIRGFASRTYLHRANLKVCPAVLLILDRMKLKIEA